MSGGSDSRAAASSQLFFAWQLHLDSLPSASTDARVHCGMLAIKRPAYKPHVGHGETTRNTLLLLLLPPVQTKEHSRFGVLRAAPEPAPAPAPSPEGGSLLLKTGGRNDITYGVEVNCDQTDAPTEAMRLGSISRSVRFCQLNPMISIRNVTHSERSNTQYLHAVGTCTGN